MSYAKNARVVSPGWDIRLGGKDISADVVNFSVNLSLNGGSASASVSLVKNFPTISPFTSLNIKMKNMHGANEMIQVFNGIIVGQGKSRTPTVENATYAASDYTFLLNGLVTPLAIPLKSRFTPTERLRWLASGINIDNIDVLAQGTKINFRETNIGGVINTLRSAASNNVLINNAHVKEAMNRLDLFADIPKALMQTQLMDLSISPDALKVDTFYVLLNDIVRKVMFEVFTDRDGRIKIKPPWYSHGYNQNYAISPEILSNYSVRTDYQNITTRVITIGALAGWQTNGYSSGSGMDEWFAPGGAYVMGGGSATTASPQLLNLSSAESKYGVGVHFNHQPMLNFSNKDKFNKLKDGGGNSDSFLINYSKAVMDYLNSHGVGGSATIFGGAPWLSPGRNISIDPANTGMVFYIQSVSHSGDAYGNAITTVNLMRGRKIGDTVTDNPFAEHIITPPSSYPNPPTSYSDVSVPSPGVKGDISKEETKVTLADGLATFFKMPIKEESSGIFYHEMQETELKREPVLDMPIMAGMPSFMTDSLLNDPVAYLIKYNADPMDFDNYNYPIHPFPAKNHWGELRVIGDEKNGYFGVKTGDDKEGYIRKDACKII